MRPIAAILALAALPGCGDDVGDALPQWLVFAGTDAPVPQLGDRLLLEVLDEHGDPCLSCRRQIGAGDPGAWPISFGVVPPEDGGEIQVRARLYRADHTGPDGLPSGLPVIDRLARLPSTDASIEVGLALSMSCLAVPSDVPGQLTCDPSTGAPGSEPLLVPAEGGGDLPSPGSWPAAAEIPCAGEPPPGMVCHPGGLFVIGDPYFFPDDPDLAAIPEHLVQLPPFALDEDEVTVGQVRALVGTGEIAGAPLTRGAAGSAEEACTFLGPTNDANDALPVNCISRAVAEDICAVLGKRLPTEAEWEFAAVNRTRETRFPWGDEENACDYAVVGRGRFVTEVVDLVDESVVCRATGVSVPWGPAAGGEASDITDLGVRNLAGNVSEWVADRYQRYDEPCWNPGPTLIVGPRCDEPSAQVGLRWSVRGGNWAGPVFQTRSVERHALLDGPSVAIGFRCAASL